MYTFQPHARILAVCLAGMLSIIVAGGAAAAPPVEPVVDAGASDTGELPAVPDHGLQQALEQLVREQGLWSQVESRKLALGLVDITDIDTPRYAALNPDHMMYAASLPKIAILLGAYVEVTEGDLQLEEGLHEDMVRMIRYSDNASATRVLEKVGREDLIDILTSERLRLYDPAHNGGLWVGKDYARQNAFRRDPLHNLSHGATVYQVARFFYLLERGDLVDDAYRDEMKEILSKPGIEHKFVAGLRNRPVTEMYRKSGTWREYHADAALVEAGGHRFIMVGLAQHPDGGKWLTRLAAPMHDLVVGGEAAGAGDEEPDDDQ
jgi:beta-lactamase class A